MPTTPAMRTSLLLPAIPLLLAGCASVERTSQMRDGVYDKPEGEVRATASAMDQGTQETDDYYDPDQASEQARGYYDMAYNDPYYYNYGRFGWGIGLGYGSGTPCGGSYWGMNYGSTFGDPWGPYGYDGWGSPYGYPYGGYGGCGTGWNDPWYGGYYGNPYYNGYGYYGYGGPCYGCYQPVVVYTNTIVGHRPGWGGGGNTGGTGGGGIPTLSPTGPMSLISTTPERTWPVAPNMDFSARPSRPNSSGTVTRQPTQQGQTRPSYQRQSGERGHSSMSSGGSVPSRSGIGAGGGSQPSIGHRPR